MVLDEKRSTRIVFVVMGWIQKKLCLSLKKKILLYLFSSDGSQMWHVGSFTVAHGLSGCGVGAQLLCGTWALSSLTRDPSEVPCIARQILNHWTTRKVPKETVFFGR